MPEKNYVIRDSMVYEETKFPTFTNSITIGPVDKTETIRIDDNTVADVTSQFDLAVGEYVELSRVERAEPLPPEPEKPEDKIARLEQESVDTMLALTEVYETNEVQDTTREQETVDTMLALTETYELVLQQQETIASLTARLEALEGGGI